MNYTELQTAIITDTHRPDLASEIPRFIRLGEGLIRRDLKAYELTATLTDADRVQDGIYTLPGTVVDIRTVQLVGRQSDGLQRVMPNAIKRLRANADVVQYAQNGDGTIEFRGIPSADNEITVRYFGTPAPLDTQPTNELLDDHEGLYQSAAQYYLYLNTQDRELAQDQATTFEAIMERINEWMARKIGGGNVAPVYNFATRSSY
jgi:hypothetical protein